MTAMICNCCVLFTSICLSLILLANCANGSRKFREDYSFCAKLDCASHASCLNCDYAQCEYGKVVVVNCTTKAICSSSFSIRKEGHCRFCWQLDDSDYDCLPLQVFKMKNCSTSSVNLERTICFVHRNVICMGRRTFFKNVRCNWSSGYSWWKTMFLSITLGGFGADRFYLGMWKSAIGKLFSFGGLGIWTVVDAVLIGVGYIGPADGSIYI